MRKVGVLLFENFETLDVFGPVEIFGILKEDYSITFHSLNGGVIKNSHGLSVLSETLDILKNGIDIFLIPGGWGTRSEVNNISLVQSIREVALASKYVLTVCTGAALLAKTGLLDGRNATSNKRAYDWVITQGSSVNWIRNARWVSDDQYYTTSGVSAGMDMALGFIEVMHGLSVAIDVADKIEYSWNRDRQDDKFYTAGNENNK